MKGLLIRACRTLKYKVIYPEKRYGVRHVSGWIEAEKITGATVTEVELRIDNLLAPQVQALSLERITAGFRLPVNFGDLMKECLRKEYRVIDRATGFPVEKTGMMNGFVNEKQPVRCR